MLIFGGRDSSGYRNDLWELSLTGHPKWRQLLPSGPTPNPRYRHTATLDPVNDRVLIFGGLDDYWYRDDLWELKLSVPAAWTQLRPEGQIPKRRASHTAVFVPDLNGIVVFGGASPKACPGLFHCAQQTNDVWLLSLTGLPAWTNLTPLISGKPPCGIRAHNAVYDAVAGQMIVIDGYGAYGADTDCFGGIVGVWTLSLRDMRWAELASGSERPRPRYFGSAMLDPDERRILVYGGGGGTPYADVWALALNPTTSWSRIAPASGIPPESYPPRKLAVYDFHRDRFVMYDGQKVWSYSLRDHGGWRVTPIVGEPPPTRVDAARIYDPVRHRVIVHGGWDGRRVLSDTWELTLDDPPTWSRLATSGEAPPSFYAAAIYDPLRYRMVLSGGYRSGTAFHDIVWALSLNEKAEWTPLASLGVWPSRAGHAAIYDQVRDEMVVFGGGGDGADSWYTWNDSWALPLSGTLQWHQLHPGGWLSPDLPQGRAFQNLTYDPIGDRMILVGGFVPGAFSRGPFDDAWEFRLADRNWYRIAPPAALPLWMTPAAAYDSRRDRVLVSEYDWLWSLEMNRSAGLEVNTFSGETPREAGGDPMAEPNLSLSFAGPNPFSESFVAEISLPARLPARLELFDVLGRRVWSRGVVGAEKGLHRVRAEGMGQLRTGVYLLRLTQARQTCAIRIVHSR